MAGDKLSKRKKKALAFRGKKVSKEDDDEEANAVPVEDTPQETSWLGNDIVKSTTEKSKKRKRTDNEPAKNTTPSKKTKPPSKSKSTSSKEPQAKKPAAKRYLLFIGNLPHLPTPKLTPLLETHFPSAPTSIRIPTARTTSKPQGFAFVEFDSSESLEKALGCHHTVL